MSNVFVIFLCFKIYFFIDHNWTSCRVEDISFPSLEVKTILLVQLNDSLKLSMKLTNQLVDNNSCNNESSTRWRDCSSCCITEVSVAVTAGTGAIYCSVAVTLIREMWRDVIGANPRCRVGICIKTKNNSKMLMKNFKFFSKHWSSYKISVCLTPGFWAIVGEKSVVCSEETIRLEFIYHGLW